MRPIETLLLQRISVWLTHIAWCAHTDRPKGLLNHSYIHGSCGSISTQYAVTCQSAGIPRNSGPAAPRRALDASFGADRAADSRRTGAGGGSALADGPSLRADRAVLPDLAAAEHRTGGQTRWTQMDQQACRRPGCRAGRTRAGHLHRSADGAPRVSLPASERAIRDWLVDLPLGGCLST